MSESAFKTPTVSINGTTATPSKPKAAAPKPKPKAKAKASKQAAPAKKEPVNEPVNTSQVETPVEPTTPASKTPVAVVAGNREEDKSALSGKVPDALINSPSATAAGVVEKSVEDLIAALEAQGFTVEEARKALKATGRKQASKRKFAEVDYTPLFTGPTDWKTALKHVDMPIQVKPAQVDLDGVDGLMEANYHTDSGRHGIFHMICVDRQNDGNWSVLSPATELYAAIAPTKIYENLRSHLDDIDAKYNIKQCYNSYTGGDQALVIGVDALDSIVRGELIDMELVLVTSLDRTKKHQLIARPVSKKTGKPIYFIDNENNQFSLATRHVTSAAEKVIDFNAAVGQIVKNWNEKIVPYVQFLGDDGFSEKEVYALLTGIVKDAKLPKSLTDQMPVITSKTTATPLEGIEAICAVIDGIESPMSKDAYADKVGKAIAKRVASLFDRKSA